MIQQKGFFGYNKVMNKISIPFARVAIFVIYFWFGILKVVGESPASEMVQSLFNLTMHKILPSLQFGHFLIAFGLLEMLIGIMFLIPKLDRISFTILVLHLFTTAMPLLLMKNMLWTKKWVPTLEAQYIIKNLAILGLGMFVVKR